jgi:hypothetical protein
MPNPQEVRLNFRGSVLYMLGWLIIGFFAGLVRVALPWAYQAFLRWACEETDASDGTRFAFRGNPEKIAGWYLAAMLVAIIDWAAGFGRRDLSAAGVMMTLAEAVLGILIGWMTVRWVIEGLELSTGETFTFTGSILGYLGWILLTIISIFTVIGWAFVTVALYRWIFARSINNRVAIQFRATGLEMLWRTIVLVLGSCLIVTIPFLMLWQFRWVVRNIVLLRASVPQTQTSPTGPTEFAPIG